MSAGYLIYGGREPAPKKRGRPRGPVKAHAIGLCEFCKMGFTRKGRADRPRRTCSIVCAAGLRRQKKAQRALARFREARRCKWLTFPRLEDSDV